MRESLWPFNTFSSVKPNYTVTVKSREPRGHNNILTSDLWHGKTVSAH